VVLESIASYIGIYVWQLLLTTVTFYQIVNLKHDSDMDGL